MNNNNIRVYKVSLTTLEPFRIGAIKQPMSEADNPLARVADEIVVQGPTLKGALRASVERHLIEKYDAVAEMKPCIPTSERTLSPEESELIKRGLYRAGGSCLYSDRNKSKSICPACYFLGAQGLIGFVRVPYLYMFNRRSPDTLYSVRIDRARGVVAERTNRDYESMPDGTEFKGELEVVLRYPEKGWELGKPRTNIQYGECQGDKWLSTKNWDVEGLIKEFLIDRLQAIHVMGGFKSKGCGKVSIKVSGKEQNPHG